MAVSVTTLAIMAFLIFCFLPKYKTVSVLLILGIILIIVIDKRDKKRDREREEKERIRAAEAAEKVAEKIRKESEKREKYQREKREEFNREVDSIEKVTIELSNNIDIGTINNLDLDSIKISKPRNGTSIYKYAEFVVIDVETTGLKATKDKIVEVSAIKYEDFEPVQAFTTLINPGIDIPADAIKINGITNEMVADAPTITQIVPALNKFVGKSNLLGQNILFDLRFLHKNGYDFTAVNRKYFDTLEIAKSKLKRYDSSAEDRAYRRNAEYEYDVFDYKLNSLCEHYGIFQSGAHHSLNDCYATAQVFISMLKNEYNLEG